MHFLFRPRFLPALILLPALLGYALPGKAQTDVLMWHNDVARTGQNLNESILTPTRVNSSNFGLLANVVVDGKVDAQPLYISALGISGGTHNVLFIATEHDSVYAVDADSGKIYWQKTMLSSGESTSDTRGCGQVVPEIGITSTPAIDRGAGAHGTIFVAAMSEDSSGNYIHRIHALDLATGAEQTGSPVVVQATFPGTGDGSSNGTVVFAPAQYKDRPALLLLNGNLYTSWSSHCDARPYSGWAISYNESKLKQTAVINFAPNGSDAAPWNSGAGPAVDANGYIYLALGNGTFDTKLTAQGIPSAGDYGNSMIKLQASTLAPVDYWTMYNSDSESGGDVDLGSGGLMVLPDQVDASGKTRHLAVAGGKDGNLYVADRDNMGHYDAANDGTIYQQLTGALPGGIWSSPAYYNSRVYYGPYGSSLRSFPVAQALLNGNSIQTTATTFGYPGTTPSISAYGTTNGIVWAAENSNSAILHAYEAGNLSTELYNSQQAGSRDTFGTGNKFIVPTIANGKVYVATTNSVGIFGFIRKTAAPVPDGPYTLMNASSNLVLDDPEFSTVSGTALYQWGNNGGKNQKWFFSYNGNGYYFIQNVASRLYATATSSTEGTALEQAKPTFDDTQLWSLTASGSGYVIKNKSTGLVFDDKGQTKTKGPYIVLWPADKRIDETWLLQ